MNSGQFKKGQVSPRKGKKMSKEYCEMARLRALGNKNRLGKKCPHTKEAKLKIGEGKKRWNKENPELLKLIQDKAAKSQKGKIMPKKSEEQKSAISKLMSGRKITWADKYSGDKHYNWKGGKSLEIYPKEFNKQIKERIRVRDNFICKNCGMPELECYRKLDIHHVDYNKHNIELSNLISLCHDCHMKTNHNREYWSTYYRSILNNVVMQ